MEAAVQSSGSVPVCYVCSQTTRMPHCQPFDPSLHSGIATVANSYNRHLPAETDGCTAPCIVVCSSTHAVPFGVKKSRNNHPAWRIWLHTRR